LYCWRVTKYDPINRDADGHYLNQKEWTCYSEVGTKVGIKEYLKIEQNYINAISSFMKEIGLRRVHVVALEQWSDEVKRQNANEFLSKIWIGKAVTVQEVQELAKLTLRNAIWCKLSFKNQFFVHFGYDYYMYIGADKDCPKAKDIVTQSRLFIERFDSPYLLLR
jgi:hypothetical protein